MTSMPLAFLRKHAPILANSSDESLVEQCAIAALHAGDKEWAAYCMARLEKKFPGSSRVARDRAAAMENAGRLEEAVEVYKSQLKDSPEDLWLRKRLACVLKESGRETTALPPSSHCIPFLQSQADTFAADPEIHHQLALEAVASCNFQVALFHFEEFLLLSGGGSVYALVAYGEALAAVGEHQAAGKIFCQALRLKHADLRSLWLVFDSARRTGKMTAVARLAKEKIREIYLANPGPAADSVLKLIG